MGAGIAQVLADVGKYNVTLADVTDKALANGQGIIAKSLSRICLLYTSPSPRDLSTSRMPSSA